ncbi:hypothetical protein [Clostridium botulinum]|uniref:hypothetical protein n=1 Tax=Clostridium botulinum TaxID=1491 RepID=UPI0018A1F441|nr:hypothetical protein [Clostridium botulinum]MCD3240657.1 hypothetical protein [Clostridium botulinum D/C]MCD3300138.1 hypothetical protein [Clostridium botulinum D/C]MCD3304645.1 hypothetical protein [Clostridium botulinum D/C]MCD3334933.1 hypothetical protein [Clostridium botulinum D/C]MCD3342665.1 hypothetical protein [Clostridium botulinum D/C]
MWLYFCAKLIEHAGFQMIYIYSILIDKNIEYGSFSIKNDGNDIYLTIIYKNMENSS